MNLSLVMGYEFEARFSGKGSRQITKYHTNFNSYDKSTWKVIGLFPGISFTY